MRLKGPMHLGARVGAWGVVVAGIALGWELGAILLHTNALHSLSLVASLFHVALPCSKCCNQTAWYALTLGHPKVSPSSMISLKCADICLLSAAGWRFMMVRNPVTKAMVERLFICGGLTTNSWGHMT